MMFFIALGVLVAAASAYLVHQFATGALTHDTSASEATSASSATDTPRETLRAA